MALLFTLFIFLDPVFNFFVSETPIRGWYRKMGLGIRGRTDRYEIPKTDGTDVEFNTSNVLQ